MPGGTSHNGGGREESLASRLAQGPLPLPLALRCATDVAAALRELHQAGRTHGEVSPGSIVLRPSGATLLPPNSLVRDASTRSDVAAFGAVLYEMLTGGKPPRGGIVATPAERVPHTGPAGLRAAATRLAAKCLATRPDQAPTIQMVVTEVRVLNVLAQQSGAESPASPPPPARAPEIRPKPSPWAEWSAAADAPPVEKPPRAAHAARPVEKPPRAAHAARPVEKPPRAAPAESFVDGEPTKEFVSAMLSREPAPAPAPDEPDDELPQEEQEGTPDNENEADDRAPSPAEKCPKCASRQVHTSHARTKFESWVTKFGIPICRCHRCYYRYFVVFRLALSKMPPE
jgi:DNA-directed RNA polymerase subunit M/transcription elongation factor TFIIS